MARPRLAPHQQRQHLGPVGRGIGSAVDALGFAPGQRVETAATVADGRPLGHDVVALVADPLRAAACGHGTGQPAAHDGVVGTLAPLDRGHDRERARGRMLLRQVAKRAAGAGEILGGQQQLGAQKAGFLVIGVLPHQVVEAAQARGGGLVRDDFRIGGGDVGMGPDGPRLLQHAAGVAGVALGHVAARGQNRGRDQVGACAIGRDRSLARADRVFLGQHLACLLQGQHGVAADHHVLRQLPLLALVLEHRARALPVALTRLQLQQHVLHFLVARLERIGLLRQLQRGGGVALGQLLAHQAAHRQKAGAVVGQQAAIDLGRPCAIAGQLGGLCGQHVGQMRFAQVFRGLVRLVLRQPPLARGDGQHPLGQRLVALALARAGEIAVDRGFIPRDETQRGKQQAQQPDDDPDQHQRQHKDDEQLDRTQRVFDAVIDQTKRLPGFGQLHGAQRDRKDNREEQQDLQQRQQHLATLT